ATGIVSSGTDNGDGTALTEAPDGPVLAAVLDRQPMFPGGIAKFYDYVGKKFTTPDVELDGSPSMRILVAFVVETDGSLTDIKAKNNPGYGLEKEAIRVLKSLKTKWEPGIYKGKKVRTLYTLPIVVK